MNLLPVPRRLELTGEMVAPQLPGRQIDRALPAQGYELHIDRSGVRLAGGDGAGLFYGEATLAQLAQLHDGALPAGVIRDHPDLPVRGVMLDISRDKVPTTASLHAVVDRLASLKVNQVQLYSEHTFAYRDHPEVYGAASPLDAEEIRELDAFCRARHVELVPNQNCLGHMNRWLAHARYRPLAVAPDGFVDPYGITRAPMTIDPSNPGSLALVRELLAELLPLFSSRRVHVGLDEAWELPSERMGDFLAWVATLRALPELAGREMLMWGDMVSGRADLSGMGHDLHTLQGSGEAHVTKGDLGKLPAWARLIKPLNLAPTTRTAFDQADVWFTIRNGTTTFNPIEFFGDAFSLHGRGTLDVQSELDVKLRVLYSRDAMHIPGVSDLTRELGGQLLVIRVAGPAAAPGFKLEFLPAAGEFAKSLGDRRAPKPPRERSAMRLPFLPRRPADDARP